MRLRLKDGGDASDVLVLSEESDIVFVGDVHADMRAMVRALLLARCVEVENEQEMDKCYEGTDEDRERRGADVGVRWLPGVRTRVVFLGDVCDNRNRYKDRAGDAEYGTCGTADTTMRMLEILARLQTEARKHGGDVRWVLGNHDILNCNADVMWRSGCKRYAAQKWRSADGQRSGKTCGADGRFDPEYATEIMKYMKRMNARAVMGVRYGDRPIALACHGGMCASFIERVCDENERMETNLNVINGMYDAAIFDSSISARQTLFVHNRESTPTLCRPKMPERSDVLVKYFGTPHVMKGHCTRARAHCVDARGSEMPMDEAIEMRENEPMLCYADVRMSRSFHRDPGGTLPNIEIFRMRARGDGSVTLERVSGTS